jgi:hypothetical protein
MVGIIMSNYYAFVEDDDGATVCLVCASSGQYTGEVIRLPDGYPDGFTCDDCFKVIL